MHDTAIVEDGEITVPAHLMTELGWRVRDDLMIEATEVGIIVKRSPDEQTDT